MREEPNVTTNPMQDDTTTKNTKLMPQSCLLRRRCRVDGAFSVKIPLQDCYVAVTALTTNLGYPFPRSSGYAPTFRRRGATHPSIGIGRLDIALRGRIVLQGVTLRPAYMQVRMISAVRRWSKWSMAN
jgi:hypothetical protein